MNVALGVAASQIATLEQGTETADATCALSGGTAKSIEIRLRMCGSPLFQLYMLLLNETQLSFFDRESAFFCSY